MAKSIAFLGRGGQGIVFAANSLSEILFNSGYYVSQLQSYGAEVRGGSVIAYTVFDREPIENPFIESFTLAVVIHEYGVKRWVRHLENSNLVVVDRDLVKTRIGNTLEAPLSSKAIEHDVYKALNMVALGLALGIGVVEVDDNVVEDVLRGKKGFEINYKAYKLGKSIGLSIRSTLAKKE